MPKRSEQKSLLESLEIGNSELRFDKTFRIAVSGDVLVTELERKIIDTLDFQRLRGVRQLGTVNFVYPTALHTRFDHSIGTLAMAERMVVAITSNTSSAEDERRITDLQHVLTRLYALLHDIAHVPFGHTIEDELQLYERHDENPARLYRFIGPESEIGSLIIDTLGSDAYDRFMAIYLWDDKTKVRQTRAADPKWQKLSQWLTIADDDIFIHDIVSNTVCADLLDYLLRDNYFCNLGITLEYRFLNFLYLHVPEGSTDRRRRVFVRLWKGHKNKPRRDTLTDLARLLEARYMVAERAYFHHAKLVTGAMLGRALLEAGSAGELTEEALYDHSDDSLLRLLRHSEAGVAATLGNRLSNRQLHKVIDVFDDSAFQQAQQRDHEIKFKTGALAILTDPNGRREFEDELSEKIDVAPGSILVYAPPSNMNLKLAMMNVRWKGADMHLCEIDDPVIRPRLDEILRAHEMLWGISLIGEPTLSDDQKALAVEEFKLRFLVGDADEHQRRLKQAEALIDLHLAKSTKQFSGDMATLMTRKSQVAAEYLATSTDKKSHHARLRAAAQRVTGDS
jgi:HD superfamily phosphohydrolase